jgi:NAD(P)H-hydrate repair Nnr-like enzyme with NAD(P)H-hydrate dehydratase domain
MRFHAPIKYNCITAANYRIIWEGDLVGQSNTGIWTPHGTETNRMVPKTTGKKSKIDENRFSYFRSFIFVF